MPPNLPGFYWDPEKSRYFKIQASQTAPPNAEWSTSAVKRRKTEAETVKKVRRRKHQIQKHIKRSPVNDLWTFTGPLTEEVEGRFKVREGDVRSMAWATGLEKKGRVMFGEDRGDGVNIGTFCVGAGAVCASADEAHVQYARTKTNGNGYLRSSRDDIVIDDDTLSVLPTGLYVYDDISSISSDADDKQLLITTRGGDRYPSVCLLRIGDSGGFASSIHMSLVTDQGNRRRTRELWSVNTSAATPQSHRLSSTSLGYLGTSMGMVAVPSEYRFDVPIPRYRVLQNYERNDIHSGIFTIDFQPGTGSSLVFGGGRSPKIWSMDDRRSWTGDGNIHTESPGTITHGSPVASIRFVNEYQLLAAGPRSKMALYDLRFTKNNDNDYVSKPVLTFPTYRNEARFDLGLDVSRDGQTVVAAQEDGGVRVFSMGSGSEVACSALGGVGSGGGGGVVRKVCFGVGGDLYLGLGGSVAKFGFGTNRLGDI